jgi:tRNA(fMet)-specific endonuclease VapC
MLDTNICIEIIRKKTPELIEQLQKTPSKDVCVSSVTLSELEYGAFKSTNPERNRLALAEFMAPIEIAPYDDRAAPYYGRLRAELESVGRPIGSLDMLIAAHAMSLGLVLVTNNTKEFSRVPELQLSDWHK